MDTQPNSSVKIDRLSSLPPELLLTIFDLAYDPDQLLLESLSKGLLPYFRRNFYRQIRLTTLSSFVKLLRTVCSDSTFGKLVMSLDTCKIYDITVLTDLETIVNAFPRLVSYNTLYVESIEPFPSSSTSPLRSLSYSRDAFVLRDFITLSQFPQLDQLQVAFDQKVLNCSLPSDVVLPQLKKLALQAEPFNVYQSGVWPRSLPVLLQRCPNLVELEITDSLRPFFVKALPDLAPLLPQLTALKLDIDDSLDEFCGIVCDQYLPLFPNLRHLDLADNTVGRSLPSYLRQLPHLSSLRLGENIHYDGPTSQDILSLVCGTSKLIKLKNLVLDCVEGKMGKHWDVDKMQASIFRDDFGSLRDWSKPGFDEEFEVEDIRQVTFSGQQNGIEISGSAVEAVAIWDAYYLESANRRVMKAFEFKTLDGLIGMKSWDYHRCPALDFDKLDPNNLKLVKIDLPEEDWFALSLE